MLIKTISYKLNSADPLWKLIPIQLDSAIYTENSSTVRQGTLIEATCTAYVPHISLERDTEMNQLASLGGLFILKTINNEFFSLGTQNLKASFSFTKLDGDKPGSKSGYNIRVFFKTPVTSIFKSFLSPE